MEIVTSVPLLIQKIISHHATSNPYRLLAELSDCEILGPILTGMEMPVCVLSQESLVHDVVNMTALSVVEAEEGVV